MRSIDADKAEEMAKMANTGVECLMGCLILHGYASLDHFEQATVLKVIGQELEKTAWRIIKNEKEGKDHADD